MNYDVSLIFATYNGEHTLNRLFDSLQKQQNIDDLKWNIIVVDNSSTDKTPDIINHYQSSLPIIAKSENKQGKNAALNNAISDLEQLGDLVIISDDDVVFSENFIYTYYKMTQNCDGYDVFGGTIQPLWEQEPTPELMKGIPLSPAFALNNTNASGEISPCGIFGPNMAVRKSIFTSGITFNEAIGPKGKNYPMGSETEFLTRLKNKGYKAYFFSEVIVEHIVRKWQFEQKWLNNRAYKAGRGAVYYQIVGNDFEPNVKSICGYPRWALLRVLKIYVKLLWIKWFKRKDKVYEYKTRWNLNFYIGYTNEFKKAKGQHLNLQ